LLLVKKLSFDPSVRGGKTRRPGKSGGKGVEEVQVKKVPHLLEEVHTRKPRAFKNRTDEGKEDGRVWVWTFTWRAGTVGLKGGRQDVAERKDERGNCLAKV